MHSSPSIHILLVEDNPSDVELTITAFQDCKIDNKISVAYDGEEALDFLHGKGIFSAPSRPDIILLDLNLPKQNGQEVLEIIKNDINLKSIPIIILTSSRAERDILRSYALHANCYIIKPADLDNFLYVVKSIEDFWLGVVRLPGEGDGKAGQVINTTH